MTRNHAKTELGWNIRSHLLQVCTHCLTEHSNAKELLQYLEGILPRRKAGSSNVKGKGPSGRSSESNRREKGMYNVSHMIRHYVPVILPWFTYISSGKHRSWEKTDCAFIAWGTVILILCEITYWNIVNIIHVYPLSTVQQYMESNWSHFNVTPKSYCHSS